MSGGQINTAARGQAQPGQDGRLATAAGTCKIAHPQRQTKCSALYHVTPEGCGPFTIEANGRKAWALDRLIEAGPKGCTPLGEVRHDR